MFGIRIICNIWRSKLGNSLIGLMVGEAVVRVDKRKSKKNEVIYYRDVM